MILTCNNCKKEFKRYKIRKFCSPDCFHEWSKGKINKLPKSIKHRELLSRTQKGIPKGPQTLTHSQNISMAKLGVKFSVEHRQALSKSKIEKMLACGFVFGGKQSSYISSKTNETNWAHSSYELRRMKYLDSSPSVSLWTKNHGITLDYYSDGVLRRYVPDFLVTKIDGSNVLEEVKGWIRNVEVFEAKKDRAVRFAAENNMSYRVLFADDLEKE